MLKKLSKPIKVVKKVFRWLFLCLMLFLLWNWEMLLYGIRQGIGQADILWNAQPIEEVLEQGIYPDSLEQKIEFIQEVKQFASTELGLATSNNYSKVYNQHNQPILWVVNACPPFSLEEYQWSYPFLGDLGYKGFFKYDLALEEANRLEAEGYEVKIGEVSAWSTLGFFNDPILSNMLYRDSLQLADLVIHELTHTTLYVKGDAVFNENLANFIGKKGAEYFAKTEMKFGLQQLEAYQSKLKDRIIYKQYLNKEALELSKWYNSVITRVPSDSLRRIKHSKIRRIFENASSLPLENPNRFYFIKNYQDTLPNNTYFTSFLMYNAEQDSLEILFEKDFDSDIKRFIKHFVDLYGKDNVSL